MRHDRIDDSRQRLRSMLDAAYGVYIKMEPKQRDSWRDHSIGELQAHLDHEVAEIKRSDTTERKLHNALDACGIAALLAAKIELEYQQSKSKT